MTTACGWCIIAALETRTNRYDRVSKVRYRLLERHSSRPRRKKEEEEEEEEECGKNGRGSDRRSIRTSSPLLENVKVNCIGG